MKEITQISILHALAIQRSSPVPSFRPEGLDCDSGTVLSLRKSEDFCWMSPAAKMKKRLAVA
jgi:hypothetical protein